jgi:pyruvate kinase
LETESPALPRRTKIVATLGPATDHKMVLDGIMRAGVNVVRVNFSHGTADDHRRRVQSVRDNPVAADRHVAILADLQGPKIRIGNFSGGTVDLEDGQCFVLDPNRDQPGDVDGVGVTYPSLTEDLQVGDTLLLDDGRIRVIVEEIKDGRVFTRVRMGGRLSDNKGINRLGGGLSAGAFTDKDRADVKLAAELEVDYLAVSFVRDAEDVREARRMLDAVGSQAAIVAKIERAEAVENIEEIVRAADAIMIARGDLGVELGDEELPAAQKNFIRLARSLDRVVITATQMMESMIENPIPTRAEVFDVANAVLDGTDAVMLSAETAVGHHPDKAVAAMARICIGAEKHPHAKHSQFRMNENFHRIDEAIAMASMYTANHLEATAIGALTESGATVLWMSRISSGIPIYALTPHGTTSRKVSLYRGVYPIAFEPLSEDSAEINEAALAELRKRGAVQPGDRVILTKGDRVGRHGGTNAMKIVEVGDGA